MPPEGQYSTYTSLHVLDPRERCDCIRVGHFGLKYFNSFRFTFLFEFCSCKNYVTLVALFLYLIEQTGFTIKQQVFDRDIPTPLLLFEFLQTLPINLYTALPEDDDDDNDDETYNPWKESDDTKVCL